MEIVELTPFEPGNPFHHDYVSCGMDLRDATTNPELKGIYIMSGMSNTYDFYIVNSHTGERFGVKL